jgi:hypothetical protein
MRMPSKSERQRRAMEAAKSGRSTIGIPQGVAREFVKADRAKARSKRTSRRGRRG